MLAQQHVPGLVDPRRKLGRAPLIRVNPLHQAAMGAQDRGLVGPGSKAQNLIGLFLGHRGRWLNRPRVGVALSVFTPAGKPAVEIRL